MARRKVKVIPDWRILYICEIGEVNAPWGWSKHLRIYRRNGNDRITWDMLQRIKNEVLGEEVLAIEIYPPVSELVNDTNMRHLWTVPRHGFLGGRHGIGFGDL